MATDTGGGGGSFFEKVGSMIWGGGGGGDDDDFSFTPGAGGARDEDEDMPWLVPRDPETGWFPGTRLPSKEAGGGYAHGYNYSEDRYPGGQLRYVQGDEMGPASLAPAKIAELQRMLIAAGLIDDVRWGIWDERSQAAYAKLLSEANMTGKSAGSLLTEYAEAAAIGEGEGGQETFRPPPLVYETTNKTDLKRVFRSAVIDLLGKGWNSAQIDELVDAYNWQEIKVQQEQQLAERASMRAEFYGQPYPEKQYAFENPPSPEAFIEEQVRQRDPEGLQENQGLGLLMGILDGWGSPTSSPGVRY